MKKFIIYISKSLLLAAVACSFVACDDSFLAVAPETEITTESFFKSPKDLEIYSNKFYGYLGAPSNDRGSDNVVAAGITNDGFYRMMRGQVSPENIGQWYGYWERMREINFLLEHAHKAAGPQEDIDHFIGVGRLFRAWYYYELVKKYSDVPWYDRTLQTTDTDLLYKEQDSRAFVVDKIFEDLEFAEKHVKAHVDGNVSKTRLTKWTVLAWKARIALHEGTMRKYHPELGLADDHKRFLEMAEKASSELIKDGPFKVFMTNGTVERNSAYEALFNSKDLLKNSEMIMIKNYNKDEGILHDGKSVFNEGTGLSRDLLDEYLALNDNGKAVPSHEVANYETKPYYEIFTNRDPRLQQTFMQAGFKMPGYSKIAYPDLNIGGYLQVKFYPTTADQIGWTTSYTDKGILRLGEQLLINAEAKAELGTLKQEDLNVTIKLLRDRVEMPAPSLSDWLSNIDPVLAAKYPEVTGNMRGAILEIRRERRVELACEGFRHDDLFRWRVGGLAAKTTLGLYVEKLGAIDITGDGVPEFYISKDGEGFADIQNQYPGVEIFHYKLSSALFSLTAEEKGFIQIKDQVDAFKFPYKYYYHPVDVSDMVVNTKLYQSPFWK